MVGLVADQVFPRGWILHSGREKERIGESRKRAPSLIKPISRNPSSADASSLWASGIRTSPREERRGECPGDRDAEADDSLSISAHVACPKRSPKTGFVPSSNGYSAALGRGRRAATPRYLARDAY